MNKLNELADRINRAVTYPDPSRGPSRGPVILGPRRYELIAIASELRSAGRWYCCLPPGHSGEHKSYLDPAAEFTTGPTCGAALRATRLAIYAKVAALRDTMTDVAALAAMGEVLTIIDTEPSPRIPEPPDSWDAAACPDPSRHEMTTERRPEDDAECERLGCEDRTHPVHHFAEGIEAAPAEAREAD